jgi:UDP-N-acetylmuramoyl-tripeptide--D-alanyl-D-alanine ligase
MAGPGIAIVVPDTAAALTALGRWARDRLAMGVGSRAVGITGSVGKTSVKDLAAAATAARWRVAANPRSFNNEQGLPITLLGAPDDSEALILEMGMRGPGEIRQLCDVARPSIGVVTLVAPAHTERVGGIDGVARAKAELIEALPPDGIAILNAGDPRVLAMAARTAARVLTFGGPGTAADVAVTRLRLDEGACASFTARTPWGDSEVTLGVPGAHMAVNAAAALAVALVCDVALDAAAARLADADLSPWRMELGRSRAGVIVLNDAYNANPTSMRAALYALAALPGGRRVAVLGLMAELDDPEPAHRAIAHEAEAMGIEIVVVGTDLYGVAPVDDAVAVLVDLVEGDAVLVKGSRVAGLELVAARLLER